LPDARALAFHRARTWLNSHRHVEQQFFGEGGLARVGVGNENRENLRRRATASARELRPVGSLVLLELLVGGQPCQQAHPAFAAAALHRRLHHCLLVAFGNLARPPQVAFKLSQPRQAALP